MTKYFCSFILCVSLLLALASCSDSENEFVEPRSALFTEEEVTVGKNSGVATAVVEWNQSLWELSADGGFVTGITPTAGGSTQDRGFEKIEIAYSENTTGAAREQVVTLANMSTGEKRQLTIKQMATDKYACRSYYVSNTGDDNAVGTKEAPFKTIAKGTTTAQPGDTVLIEGGTYSEHSIKPNSGTSSAMIVIKPADELQPVYMVHPATSTSDATSIFLLSSVNYVHIEGLTFHDYLYGNAILLDNGAIGNEIFNCRFEHIGCRDVQVWPGMSCVCVNRNAVDNAIVNNYFEDIYGDGIGGGNNCRLNLIAYNTFVNFHGKGRGWSPNGNFSSGITYGTTSYGNNVMAFNKGENILNLLWFDRDGSTSIVLRNEVHDSQLLMFNESRCARNVVQENVAWNTTSAAYQTAQYETGYTSDARWINNVAYNCKRGFYFHKSYRNEVRGNIAYNNKEWNVNVTDITASDTCGPHKFAYNLWFTDGNDKSLKYKNSNVTMASFDASMGETNSLSVDPLFTNPGNADFTLSATSPVKGVNYKSTDMGAYAVYGYSPAGYSQSSKAHVNVVGLGTIYSNVRRGGSLYLQVKLNCRAVEPVTVKVKPVAGDAVEGKDFDMSAHTVTFSKGEMRKVITINFKDAAIYEQLVAFGIESASGADIGPRRLSTIVIQK